MADVVVAGYGAALVCGGAVGFAKKGSVPSLVAGGGSGLFFLLASRDLEQNAFACKIVASLLCLGMSVRASKAAKLMPAGGVAALSGIVLLYLLRTT